MPNKEQPIIVVDSRESLPFKFIGETVITKKLDSGDYSLVGFESAIAIERKSGTDFLGSISSDRDRFKNCLLRLQSLERAYIIVECQLGDLMDGVGIKRNSRGEEGIKPNVKQKVGIHPNSLFGTVVSIMTRYNIPIIFSKNRKEAERFTLEILKKFHSIKRSNG